jgi:hypothetical protein
MIMSNEYTLRLLSLQCLQAQESDGDEIYLKLNNAEIWRFAPDKMTQDLTQKHSADHVDFAGARKHTREGWQAMPALDPNAFVFTGLTGTSVLQVWDDDLLLGDDLLGEAQLTVQDAERGDIAIVFQRDGGHYRLIYQVSV